MKLKLAKRRYREWLHPYLQPGDGVLDIGANIGTYSVGYAAIVGPTGHVLCVEPDPRTLMLARHTLMGLPQVDYLDVACDATAGYRDLMISWESVQNSFHGANVPRACETVSVPTMTLDALAARVRRLKAIKIDTQGHEWHVLKGGPQTLARDGLVCQIEVWPKGLKHAGASVGWLIATLREHGWQPLIGTWPAIVKQATRCTLPHSSFDILVTR